MKLHNLFENDLRQAVQKHLVVSVSAGRGIVRTESKIYVISDVPRLNEEKLFQLLDLSFKEGAEVSLDINFEPINLIGYHSADEVEEWLDNLEGRPFEVLPWKTVVAEIKEDYPPDDDADYDDFDE